MKCVKSINIYHVLVTIISLGTFFFIGSIIQVEAVKKNGTLLEDYNNLKELVGDIRNGNFSDDQISLNDFKNSDAYQHADENMHDCIKLAAKIGHNLGDREIVHCFEDANYFKQKYSIGNNKTNKTNIKGADSINNATSADTNATSADTNVTSADTNVTSADTNVTGSSSDTNVASADTNVTGSSSDTNVTSADTNVTTSKYDTNATSADTNVTTSSSDTNATSADTNASRISITDIFNRPYFKIS
jgi:hypothetical protein